MAVTKLWSVTHSLKKVIDYANNPEKTSMKDFSEKQYQALADVLTYAKDEEKTEKVFYAQGVNCNVTYARDEFVYVKDLYNKQGGVQAYHGYMSFREQNITPELAQKIGMEFAQRVWGKRFQVVVTTHLNTRHLHCHFVINSVSFVDGYKLQNNEKLWYRFRHIADEVCKEYGLYYDPNPELGKTNNYHYYQLEKAGMPTRYSQLREAIDDAISKSKSKTQFAKELDKLGYKYQLDDNRKYWTIVPLGFNKPIRLKRLGDNYTNEAIIKRLYENYYNRRFKPFQPRTVVIRQYRLQTREHKIKKMGGLYGLYLHYCYKLGYLPKYKKQNSARLHYLLRDDLLKLDKITAEVRLLGSNKIQTEEQLLTYKDKAIKKIETLTSDRTELRRKSRRKLSDEELSKTKEEIYQITDKLKELRKEVKLCDSIEERSKSIHSNLSQVLADEDKIKGKETKIYEQQR